jgi:hypothetical protein
MRAAKPHGRLPARAIAWSSAARFTPLGRRSIGLGYTPPSERATDGRHHPRGADRAVGSGASDRTDPDEGRAGRISSGHGGRESGGAPSLLHSDTQRAICPQRFGPAGRAGAASAGGRRCSSSGRSPCRKPSGKHADTPRPATGQWRRDGANARKCAAFAAAEQGGRAGLASCEVDRTSIPARDRPGGWLGGATGQLCQPRECQSPGPLPHQKGLSHVRLPCAGRVAHPLASPCWACARSRGSHAPRHPVTGAGASGRAPAAAVTRFERA